MAIFDGDNGNDPLNGGDDDDILNGFGGDDALLGGDGNDTLNGGDGDDVLNGGDGDDILNGEDGSDWLYGGSGSDTLNGGAGNDLYDQVDADDIINEDSDAGIDSVYSIATWTLGANLENLYLDGEEAIDGIGNELDNIISGNYGRNALYGGAGNDTLLGGGGDFLDGGAGNDSYFVDANDTIVEDVNAGIDSVYAYSTWTLGENLENLTLLSFSGNNPINGIGNELDNTITGNDSNNILFGGEGNDWLEGLNGDDTLEGGAGADTLIGGAGNDLYSYVNTDDVILESDGLTGGIDTVESLVSWTLGDSLENLNLLGFAPLDNPINGTGNELDNTITGNDSNNILSAKQGNDTLLGGGGNDRIVGGIGDDILTGGDGADRFYRWRSTTGIDTITDFQVGEDKLYFSARGFGGDLVSGGVLGEEQFTLGTSATTQSDRFIYDTDTGNLFFDIDGTGDIAQVQIATLSSGLAMTNADIFIFV